MENISELSPAERETHLNQAGDDHNTWTVYTDDPYWIRRLDKITEATKIEPHGGKHYTLDKQQVSLRKKRKPISAEQRQVLRERALKNLVPKE